jgi:hypothetical protein
VCAGDFDRTIARIVVDYDDFKLIDALTTGAEGVQQAW